MLGYIRGQIGLNMLDTSGRPELKTLEWWISGLMLNTFLFLISRLNIACSPHEFKLQKSQPIEEKANKKFHMIQVIQVSSLLLQWNSIFLRNSLTNHCKFLCTLEYKAMKMMLLDNSCPLILAFEAERINDILFRY